jgi:hypothetical protein
MTRTKARSAKRDTPQAELSSTLVDRSRTTGKGPAKQA